MAPDQRLYRHPRDHHPIVASWAEDDDGFEPFDDIALEPDEPPPPSLRPGFAKAYPIRTSRTPR